MILANKSDLKILKDLGNNFEKIYNFITKVDYSQIPIGKTHIDGINAYCHCEEIEINTLSESIGISYDGYALIVMMVIGYDYCAWLDVRTKKDNLLFIDNNSDLGINRYKLGRSSYLYLDDQNFLVLFPNDVFVLNFSFSNTKRLIKQIRFFVKL